MEYQEKLIILPVQVRGVDDTLNITVHEAIGTGLAYHIVAGGDKSDGFVITHLESKKALCKPIATEHETKLVMERVVGITDWNMPEEELKKHPVAGMQFLKIQQTVEGEINQQLETAMETCMPNYLVEATMEEISQEDYPILLRTALLYAFKIIPSNVGA
jgi:hypothetical protein